MPDRGASARRPPREPGQRRRRVAISSLRLAEARRRCRLRRGYGAANAVRDPSRDRGAGEARHLRRSPRTSSRPADLALSAPASASGLAGRPHRRASLHDRFADARLHGEWFTCTPELHELLRRHATTVSVVAAAASSGAKLRTRQAQAPRRPIPAGHPGVDAAPTYDHPTWRDFVMLGPGERRDADKWVAAALRPCAEPDGAPPADLP
jgi:hypothetical protein